MFEKVVTATGTNGRIAWQYFVAADVCAFTVSRDPRHRGRWTVSGTIINDNAYKLAQTPLVFSVPTKFGEWRWPILTLTINPDTHAFIADLGEIERRRAAVVTAPGKDAPPHEPIGLRGSLNHPAYARRW